MRSIPIIYYHSIGEHIKSCPWSFLTVPTKTFIAQIEWLKKKKFFFATHDDVYAYMSGLKKLPAKSVMLSFDDGFLDNYTIVWPLAMKYDFSFTVYVSPDFVEHRRDCRPTIKNIETEKIADNKFQWWGYLSWEEMRVMEKSGLVDIQSHCMTHTWYPVSGKVIDFHHPMDNYYWLWWNKFPDKKPYWLKEYQDNDIPFGTPIFEHSKSLVAKKSDVKGHCIDGIIEYVSKNGGKDLFNNLNWRKKLFEIWNKKNKDLNISIETDKEQQERIYYELSMSKKIIEEQLNKSVNYLAWPGGGGNESLRKIALEVGYKATTKGLKSNSPGVDPSAVQRGSACFPTLIQPALSKLFLNFQIQRLSKPSSLYSYVFEGLRKINRK